MSIEAIRELIAITQPDGNIELEWHMLTSVKDHQESISMLENRIYSKFTEVQNTGAWLLELAFSDVRTRLSSSMDFWRNFAGNLEVQLRKMENPESARTDSEISLTSSEFGHILDAVPLTQGSEYVTLSLLQKNWNELIRTFRHNLAIFNGTVEEYVQTFNPDIHLAGRVYFHLVENQKGNQPFAFMATYSTRLTESGKSRHVPLKFALQEFSGRRESLLELLSTVYTASAKSNLINGLIESGELFHPLSWTPDEAYTFLSEVDIYEQSGIICRIPNWWKTRASKLSLTVSLGDKQPPMVGLDAIISISPSLSIDGIPISKEEIQLLLQ
ncbi:MAG: ATP-dependent helicase, partial [Spirochaetes bacterium]